MKIEIDPFDISSIDKAIKEVEKIQKNLEEGCERLVELLAQDGIKKAQANFDAAVYAGEKGDIEYKTKITKLSNGGYKAIVSVEGDTVGFIEFGTGIRFPMGDTSNYMDDIPAHGTYGDKRGADPKGWWYKGYPNDNLPEGTAPSIRRTKKGIKVRTGNMHTYGNPANSCMHNAYEEVQKQINARVKEAFRL